MTDEELRAALDHLFADEDGADSDVHDGELRARCIEALKERRRDAAVWRPWITRLIRDMWATDEAIEEGYGIGDALEFIEWLADEMDCDVTA